jgi:predicted dehydrogenase
VIRVGVIGYGYWGPNLVRNFAEVPGSVVGVVCDLRPERLAQARARYPAIATSTDFHALINDTALDVVVIATPVFTHFELALEALRSGKHVFVEKPLTATSRQSAQLIEEADRRGLILMVDHTFIYTGAVRKIKELVDSRRLGQLYYYDSVRVNLGLFQHDVNVIWDLAVHDLSIMHYILGVRPSAVSTTGIAHISGEPEDVAYLTCFFDQGLIAHIHVNWLAPVKIRRTLLGGDREMIVYDDLEPSEKVKVYDKGITVNSGSEGVYQMLVSYRTGDMWAPRLDTTEALRTEALHFLQCVESGERPLTDGRVGMEIVRMLEAATESMWHRGRPVELNWKAA